MNSRHRSTRRQIRRDGRYDQPAATPSPPRAASRSIRSSTTGPNGIRAQSQARLAQPDLGHRAPESPLPGRAREPRAAIRTPPRPAPVSKPRATPANSPPACRSCAPPRAPARRPSPTRERWFPKAHGDVRWLSFSLPCGLAPKWYGSACAGCSHLRVDWTPKGPGSRWRAAARGSPPEPSAGPDVSSRRRTGSQERPPPIAGSEPHSAGP